MNTQRAAVHIAAAMFAAACAPASASLESSARTRIDVAVPTDALIIEFDRASFVSVDTLFWPAREVRARLPAVYAGLGLRGAGFFPGTGDSFGAVNRTIRRSLGERPLSRFLECGSAAPPRADTHNVTLSVFTRIDSIADATTVVRSQLRASASDPAIPGPPIQCTSTGRLERRIGELLEGR